MRKESSTAAVIGIVAIILCGCAEQPKPTTRPSIATTQPSYWYAQPASSEVSATDSKKLWNACEESARHYGFVLDRQDYRGGVLTTDPLISKQFFEFWRNDVQTAEDLADSSINTYRRTLRFVITKQPSGEYVAAPFVLIERFAQAEHPVSSQVYLRNAFRTQGGTRPAGTPEADRGVYLPTRYWYATGRDQVLEKDVAKQVRKWMN